MLIESMEPRGSTSVRSRPVEIRDSAELPYEIFVRDYMATNRPVVVRNATAGWPAMRTWTPEFFKTRFGSKKVQVSYEESMTFSDFIDGVLASTYDRPGPYMYRLFIHEHLPELLSDLCVQNPYSFPRRYASPLMRTHWRRPDGYLKLLIGGVGARFPVMHYDSENAHATVTEIYGDKEFLLYPPGDREFLIRCNSTSTGSRCRLMPRSTARCSGRATWCSCRATGGTPRAPCRRRSPSA
jgi:hypothetical protein